MDIFDVPPRKPHILYWHCVSSPTSACFVAKMSHLKMSSEDHTQALELPYQLEELEMFGSLYPLQFLFLPSHPWLIANEWLVWEYKGPAALLRKLSGVLLDSPWIRLSLSLHLNLPPYLGVPFPALLVHAPTSQWFVLGAYP